MTDEKFYTSEELDEVMYSYIRETADELKIDLKEKILTKKNIYV